MEDERCDNCSYHIQIPLDRRTVHRCRRFPPSRISPSLDAGQFPRIEADDWCGEHRALPTLTESTPAP